MSEKCRADKVLTLEVNWEQYRSMPLRESIYIIVKQAILEGKLEPGQRFTEEKLAEKMGVSRTPVREALRRLESEGYVSVYAGKYVEVSAVGLEDLFEEYALREVIEGLAARLAAKHCTTEDIQTMKFHLHTMRVALDNKDTEGVVFSNASFHSSLVEATRNSKIKEVMTLLWKSMLLRSTNALQNMAWAEESLREHTLLLQALTNHDADLAEKVSKEHVRHAKKALTGLRLDP